MSGWVQPGILQRRERVLRRLSERNLCLRSMEDCPVGCNPVYYRDGKGYCDGCPSGTYEKDNGLWIDCVDCTQDNHCDEANCETCVNNTCQLSCQDEETCDGKGNCCPNGIGNDGNCCEAIDASTCTNGTTTDTNGCTICNEVTTCSTWEDCQEDECCDAGVCVSHTAFCNNRCTEINESYSGTGYEDAWGNSCTSSWMILDEIGTSMHGRSIYYCEYFDKNGNRCSGRYCNM